MYRYAIGRSSPFEVAWRSLAPDLGCIYAAFTGFLPVFALAVALVLGVPLSRLAPVVMVPVLGLGWMIHRRRRLRRLLWVGLLAGILATVPYDLFRLGWTLLGGFPGDGIPNIGRSLDLEPYWVSGYLWRFVGDGGGMGLSFAALGMRGARAGVAFGLFVASCLFVTLAATPPGVDGLFPCTASAVIGAGIGHVVYGAVLGSLVQRWRA